MAARDCKLHSNLLMANSPYSDPRLAAVYEALNPAGPDDIFYLNLAGAAPKTILDVGCGTGRLACSLAERGHAVTGVDLSSTMLDVARHRAGSERVRWVTASATSFSLAERFDLVLMTGHAFQNLLTDEDVKAALRTFRHHLLAAGRLAFESRNPLVRTWETWKPAVSARRVSVPNIGEVQVHHSTTSIAGEIVTYETHFQFPNDDLVVVADTLRFVTHAGLGTLLSEAGFTEVSWFGDWQGSPFTDLSPEIIVVASGTRNDALS